MCVLDYKYLISQEIQVFSGICFLKALNSLENVCLEFSGCCVLINRHFDHVNEAAVQVYKWLIGIMPCTGDP